MNNKNKNAGDIKNSKSKKPWKRIDFKDFMNVDRDPGQSQLIKYNSHQNRRRVANEDALVEVKKGSKAVLSYSARQKKSRDMKKNRVKLKRGKWFHSRRTAGGERQKVRQQQKARRAMFKKLTKGKARRTVSLARRKEVEKRMANFDAILKYTVKKSLPGARRKEVQRKKVQTK